jgi:histidinol-phosphatase (PHP family)
VKTNYHTHTVFCDGKDSPEAMAAGAIEKGFDILGFSAHALYPFADLWHVPARRYGEYTEVITALKAKYQGRMEILIGFEVDFLPPFCVPDRATFAALGADYIIGSVHYLTREGIDGGWFGIDASIAEVAQGIAALFGGDGKKAVQEYFAREREMFARCDFDIAGHIDLVRKRNGTLRFFDETEPWYQREIEATAKAASDAGVIVEINTGGIGRGAMNDVYPSADFLRLLRKYNVPVTINSDAHAAPQLDAAFDFAKQRAREAGYAETVYLSGGKIQSCPL